MENFNFCEVRQINSFTLLASLGFRLQHYKKSRNNFNLKSRYIFFKYFMGSGFHTIYYFCREPHLKANKANITETSTSHNKFRTSS